MKKTIKINLVLLIAIAILIIAIVVGIVFKLINKQEPVITRMSTALEEKTFGTITATVLPDIVGTWYSGQENDEQYLTISNIRESNLVGNICLEKSSNYIVDFEATKQKEGIYDIKCNEFRNTLQGTIELKEKTIEVKIEKTSKDATYKVKQLEGQTIVFDYKDTNLIENIFNTDVGNISVHTNVGEENEKTYREFINKEEYIKFKNEIIRILEQTSSPIYTVYAGTLAEPNEEVNILENLGKYDTICIDTRDIFIPDNAQNPIIIFWMSVDEVYYTIIDTTDSPVVREEINALMNEYIDNIGINR